MKFTQVKSNAGAPRTNTSNRKGNVRITVTLSGAENNVTRSLTVQDATVTEVFAAIKETLVSQPA